MILNSPDIHAWREPDKPAIIAAETCQSISYGDLADQSARLAAYFHRCGLRQGHHVAALVENRPELLILAWACQRSGLYYTPINTHLHARETAFIMKDCAPRAFVTSQAFLGHIPAIGTLPTDLDVKLLIDGGTAGYRPWAEAIAADPWPGIAANEGQWMLYSSGTSGVPKGVKRPPRDVPFGTPTPGEAIMAARWEFGPETVYLSAGPLYHMGPLSFAMGTLRHGGTVILMTRFDAGEALRLIDRYRVTHSFMVPTHFVRLLEHRQRDTHVPSLKAVLHSGAPCPIEVKMHMLDWWGPVLHEFYGMTEGIGACIIGPEGWRTRRGSVGKPENCRIWILGEQGQELPPGETGQIWISGTTAFDYHNDPERTASAYDAAGRATVGDLGYLDAEGYLYLTGRASDLIISGGVNVAPAEAERVLATHPAVADCAVIGRPDPEFGERVHAVVVCREGQGDDALAAALIAHCRANLAHFKCPRGISFADALPRSETGKLRRRLL